MAIDPKYLRRLRMARVTVPEAGASEDEIIDAYLEAIKPFSPREAARISGISHTTITKLRAGHRADTYRSTLSKMVDFLHEAAEFAAPPTPAPTGSMAEQLIHFYDHPEFVRRVAGVLSVQDRIAAAYAVALGKRFPPEEMRKLDEWRDRLLADEAEQS